MTPNLLPTSDPAMDTRAKVGPGEVARYIRFGPFQIDRQRQQVFRGGSRLKLQGKVYQVPAVLVERQGQIVTREELRQALWPADTYVNYDANVNTTVNKLRQVLGDSTDKPLYIETIPRKGYTFAGQVEFSSTPFPESALASQMTESEASEEDEETNGAGETDISNRWLTVGVILLILAGILFGAGMAALWISRFGAGPKQF